MDAAALNLSVDSSSVLKAANDLDRFSAASEKAAAAGKKVNLDSASGSIAKLVALVQSVDSKLGTIVSSLNRLSAANDNVAASSAKAAAALNTLSGSFRATSGPMSGAASAAVSTSVNFSGVGKAAQQADAHVAAFRAQIAAVPPAMTQADAHVIAYRESLTKVADGARQASTAIKFTAQESLGATRQLADIGVTAASGMSPFLIAIQQGPQLLDILQNKAAMTGQTLGAVFRAAAAAIWAALAPFLPMILAVAAGVALLTAGVAALSAKANDTSGLRKFTTDMGYTKEEVKKLNAVTVTFGDTTKAVFQVALQTAAKSMGINTKTMAKTWDKFLDYLATGTRATLAGIYAGLAGTKAYLGELSKPGAVLNVLTGNDPTILRRTYGASYAEGQKFLDKVVDQARKNARTRQNAMAKSFYDAPAVKKEPKGPKTDAEKLADIYTSAQADIAVEQARADAVGKSAQAALELEQRTKLLNQIEKAKIPITDAVRAKVDELAGSYAKVKVATDAAAAVRSVTDSLAAQNDAINDDLALVGLYGDALTKARIETEALARARAALPKGTDLTPQQYKDIIDATKPVVRDQLNLDRAGRIERIRRDAEDMTFALDRERAGLGLTGAAAISYSYVTDKLMEARRANVILSATEVAGIENTARAYGQAAEQMNRLREVDALQFRGLDNLNSGLTDAILGVRTLGSVFSDVAQQIISDLIKIAIRRSIVEPLANTLFSSGSTNFLSNLLGKAPGFAKGGTFGTPQRFAQGGTFTNSVVNTPTLFRFAKGSALGEMGEAGPEAVMPLGRDSQGRLGVHLNGGGRPNLTINTPITITQSGSFTTEDARNLAVSAGEEAVAEARRQFQNWAVEWENSGAVV